MIPATLHKTATGNYWLPDTPNCGICRCIKAGGIYDWFVVDTLKPYIREGSTVVDMGACFGQMSVLFSKMTGPNGHVVSIEADQDIFGIVEKNLVENGCTNAKALLRAAWDVSGVTLEFPVADMDDPRYPCYGCWGLTMKSKLGFYKVESLALDCLELKDVSAIKVDVQGADLRALRGSVETIKRCRPVILYEYERTMSDVLGCPLSEYGTFIANIGYKIVGTFSDWNFLAVPK